MLVSPLLFFFFFNDTATTEIYPLSLHDALPISNTVLPVLLRSPLSRTNASKCGDIGKIGFSIRDGDRKSTRLNSSHSQISYAVFCLKKKKTATRHPPTSTTACTHIT